MNVFKYLSLAADVSRLKDDGRRFCHGAVGIRKDGVLVCAANGNPKEPEPEHHCEARVLRKLGKGGIIFLVRTASDGSWRDSKPCPYCQARLKAKDVLKVYYSDGYRWSCYYPALDRW